MKQKRITKTFQLELLNIVLKLVKGQSELIIDGLVSSISRCFRLEADKNQPKELREIILRKLNEIISIEIRDSRTNLVRIFEILESIDEDKNFSDEIGNIQIFSRINSDKNLNELRNLYIKAPSCWKVENPYADLELAWQTLSENRPFLPEFRSTTSTLNPFTILCRFLQFGIYPPPEVLKAIELAYERYLNGNGDISLDKAFFGTEHSKLNSVAYKERTEKYSVFHTLVVQSEYGIPKEFSKGATLVGESLSQKSEYFNLKFPSFFKEKKAFDVDSFLKGYRRWKQLQEKPLSGQND